MTVGVGTAEATHPPVGVDTTVPGPAPLAEVEVDGWRMAVHGAALAEHEWPSVRDDADHDGYVYQTREYLALWLATLGTARRAEACLVVLRDRAGVPRLWLPLVIEREFGCTLLRFPDAGMADYNAPILARDGGSRGMDDVAEALPRLWPHLLRLLPGLDVVDFVKMPATVWDRPNPLLRVGRVQANGAGFYLPVAGTFEAYCADPARKPRVRKLGQLARKLAREAPVCLAATQDPAAVAAARAFLEDHKDRQYRRTLGFSQFDRPGVRAFLDRLCAPDTLGRLTRLTTYTAGESIVGAQLDFVTPRRQQGFITTFDAERFAIYSPGRQIALHLIARAFADGLAVFDLGHGDNPFKHPWMTHELALFDLAQPVTLRGRAFCTLRRLRRRLPEGLSRRLKPLLRGRDAPLPRAAAGTDDA